VTVLALDLTSESGSLAIRQDGETVLEHSLESRIGFAHLIFPAIERILAEAGMSLPEFDCFAASTGPGAFTGLRVALAAVKGLAEVVGKPAIGISKMRAMASFGTGDKRIVLLDARRGEVFAAVYDSKLEPVGEETVTEGVSWLAALPANADCQILTTQADWVSTLIANTRFETAEIVETPRCLAGAIAACAEADLLAGGSGEPALLDANYVRRSDAELYWTDN
jgi:tRNA threonylcarbamoyladenosine biosynthesis protein TsaB